MVDKTFVPMTLKTTQLIHFSVTDHDWELVVDGPKFDDTRVRAGGNGSVDLVMHLWQVQFKQAVRVLTEAGV